MDLIKFCIKRPVAVTMAVLLIIVLGVVSLTKVPVDLLPEMDLPILVAFTTYVGAGPEEVENAVTKPLEEHLATASNLSRIRSISTANASIVVLEFNWGTDLDSVQLDVRQEIDMVEAELPDGVDRPLIMKMDPSSMPIMMMAASAEDTDLPTLNRVIEDKIKDRLERIDGVAFVSVEGGPVNEVRVLVDQERLSGYGLSILQLVQVLKAENLNIPAGDVVENHQKYIVRITGEFNSVEEIRQLTMLTPRGVPIRLCDVATVEQVQDQSEQYSILDGVPAIGIGIRKESEANTVQVARAVKEEMAKISEEMPGFKYNYAFDQSEFIEASIKNLFNSIWQGGLLAVIVLYLFLQNFRSTLIIALTIPIAIIATFVLMYFKGLTFNMMSLGGLALGVGMLVSNSIVVLDNIYRRQDEEDEKPFLAAERGTIEVTNSVLGSTLTTVAVFLPIVFVEGLVSQIFNDLSLTVTYSLLVSMVAAVTLIPMMSARMVNLKEDRLREQANEKNKFQQFVKRILGRVSKRIDWLTDKYRQILSWSLDNRRKVFAAVLVALVICMVLLPVVGTEFFPIADVGRISVSVELPSGSTIEETKAICEQIEGIARELPEVDTVFSTAGTVGLISLPGMPANSEQGSLDISLVDRKQRKLSDQQVADAIRAQTKLIAGADIGVEAVSLVGMSGGTDIARPININIRGDDMDTLRILTDQLADLARTVPGTREVDTSFAEGRPEVQVILDRTKAAPLGFTAGSVGQVVRTAVNGVEASKYRVAGDEVDMVVQLTENQRKDITNLKGLILTSPTTGLQMTLGDIADVVITEGPQQVERDNQQRSGAVTADTMGRPMGTVHDEILEKVKQMKLPEGYTVSTGGQAKLMADAFEGLAGVMILAVILVYMIMAAQFESLLHPFAIMFSLPLAIIGVVPTLLITRTAISVPAFMGAIVLVGTVVNNAIVLVDYTNVLRGQGYELREAIMRACPTRLRPIMETTLTTVLGLLPLAIATGEGASLQRPLAITVIGGLVVSATLILIVIPLVYTWLEDISEMVSGFFRKKKTAKGMNAGA